MKAVFIERYGGPEVLKYGDLPNPVAAPGEVVIDVVAASVNAADWKARAGQYAQSKLPLILGRDFSGVVSTVGNGVEDLKIGDSVFGVCEAGKGDAIHLTQCVYERCLMDAVGFQYLRYAARLSDTYRCI